MDANKVQALISLMAKPSQIDEGVTGYFIPHRTYKQNITHAELSRERGDFAAWSNMDALLWVLDAQTIRIEVDETASPIWCALSTYLKNAPDSIITRMGFYAYLSSECIEAWWDAYDRVQDKPDAVIEERPPDPNLPAAGGTIPSES